MTDPTSRLVESIAAALVRRGETVATAESCTGGLIAKLMTDRAGSSEWFERGAVTYSNAAKQELLGVPPAIIAAHGAVSEPTVLAMAEGLLQHAPAHWSIAVTGVAGPGGGSPEKPVGTVWIAWCRRGARAQPQRFTFAGDRESVRAQSAHAALAGLLERIERQ